MTGTTFSSEFTSVEVNGRLVERSRNFLERYLRPFLPEYEARSDGWVVNVERVEIPAIRDIELPGFQTVVQVDEDTRGPPSAIGLDADNRFVRLLVGWHTETPYVIARIVRALQVIEVRRAGYIQIHAAAFRLAGRTVVLVGDKGAGKTSILLGALRIGGRFIANDRLLVKPAARPQVVGLPHSVGVRKEVRMLYPNLFADPSYYWQDPGTRKTRFTVAELCDRFDTHVVPTSAADVVAFPCFDPEVGAPIISPEDRSVITDYTLTKVSDHQPLWDNLLPKSDDAGSFADGVAGVRIRFGPGGESKAARSIALHG